ncbi:MAG: hypothetical protein A2Y41_05360 [Spirochaetes bacterium GWB1_36_13]|nr:MAG: hypothetical protein A2Y41_05360 [Spirochaetes bacterium GWB1_36_13]
MNKNLLLNSFIEELEKSLDTLESSIIHIGKDKEALNNVFRVFHSLKSSAKLLGYPHFGQYIHEVENLLSKIRNKEMKAGKSILSFLFKNINLIQIFTSKIVLGFDEKDFLGDLNWQEKIAENHKFISQFHQEDLISSEGQSNSQSLKEYQILIQFDPQIFFTGSDPLIFIESLAHETRVLSFKINKNALPDFDHLNPLYYYLIWDIKIETLLSTDKIKKIFDFLDEKKNQIKIIPLSPSSKKIKERPIEKQKFEKTYIRVNASKLDEMLNLFGELVIEFSQIKQHLNIEKQSQTENFERIVKLFQDKLMNMRLLSIAPLFNQFYSMVLDITGELNKKAEIKIAGEETELDKNIIEQIQEPLKHIIRNALDHGIETPAERIRNGKNETALITLEASYKQGNIYITVSDDGRGLDKEKILKKAVQNKLVSEKQIDSLKDSEIWDFIFYPGFTTQEHLTELSGRGVGMDVVRKNIENLRGSIEIQTEKNKGTSFIIKLPLTLSIIDAILFQIGDETLCLPSYNIKELLRLKNPCMTFLENKIPIINIRNHFYPVFFLDSFFSHLSYQTKDFSKLYFILMEIDNKRFLLASEKIIGEQQIVIKKMKSIDHYHQDFLGSSILGNGDIIFILDPFVLIHKINKNFLVLNQEDWSKVIEKELVDSQ